MRSPTRVDSPGGGLAQMQSEHLSRQSLSCQEKHRGRCFAGSSPRSLAGGSYNLLRAVEAPGRAPGGPGPTSARMRSAAGERAAQQDAKAGWPTIEMGVSWGHPPWESGTQKARKLRRP